jgi:hypothetical protein
VLARLFLKTVPLRSMSTIVSGCKPSVAMLPAIVPEKLVASIAGMKLTRTPPVEIEASTAA